MINLENITDEERERLRLKVLGLQVMSEEVDKIDKRLNEILHEVNELLKRKNKLEEILNSEYKEVFK